MREIFQFRNAFETLGNDREKMGAGKSSLLDALAKAVHASVYENTS